MFPLIISGLVSGMQEFPPVCAYCTHMRLFLLACIAAVLLTGCHQSSVPNQGTADSLSPPQRAAAANTLFLNQKIFDPWKLTYNGSAKANDIPLYRSNGLIGIALDINSNAFHAYQAGLYMGGVLQDVGGRVSTADAATHGTDTLNMRDGTYTPGLTELPSNVTSKNTLATHNWPVLWRTSDVVIDGDPEAQQVTHANLFYLLSSTYPGSDHSIPPMGLSSNVYGGHIFWDAEVWMLPALLPQHPEYAKPIINYRFKLLGQARRNAHTHGYKGAEFPWESADTGAEVAPAEFAQERHITADIAWAAWQYYLWTGDKTYLRTEGWPLLRDCADYWVSRVTPGPAGQFHINHVVSPDETAGVVDDDAWTNGVVGASLRAAGQAAALLALPPDPRWAQVSAHLARPFDKARGIPQENSRPLAPRFAAKQADTLLLIHPLRVPFDSKTRGRMLDYYAAHTIATGPAMTASIHAIVAANLGRAQLARDEFQASYQPFERGPWDAFSEKRTTNNVYFLTGMAGCVQAVLYGFAGLNVAEHSTKGQGIRLAGDSIAELYADPHLPPGWTSLTLKGVLFRGQRLDMTVLPGNRVTVTERPAQGAGGKRR